MVNAESDRVVAGVPGEERGPASPYLVFPAGLPPVVLCAEGFPIVGSASLWIQRVARRSAVRAQRATRVRGEPRVPAARAAGGGGGSQGGAPA